MKQTKRELVLDGTKLAWHRERVEDLMRGERVAPITVDMALTRACTYRCVYCYGKLQENDIKRMTWPVLEQFLDDAKEIGVKAVSLVSDGESTCSPHVYEFIRHGKANGLSMAIGTNGFLLKDEELAGTLPNLDYIRFNVSAADMKRYCEIMGTTEEAYRKVRSTIQKCVQIKQRDGLEVTIGLQMVLMPQFADQIIPMADMGAELGVDYTVIKHCSDDEQHTLGVDYEKYSELEELLREAEKRSTPDYLVAVKWSKIRSKGLRDYDSCLAPPLIIQISGSGLVAPCGMLFNDRYKEKFHIGNIADTPFKEIWKGKRYWEVMGRLADSKRFNPHTMCGTLCLQHKCNEALWEIKQGATLEEPRGEKPMHNNFI